MSALLDALVAQRRQNRIEYKTYLEQIAEIARQAKDPSLYKSWPPTINSPAKRAIYEIVAEDEPLALEVDAAIRNALQDGWRVNRFKLRKVEMAVKKVVGKDLVDDVVEVAKRQSEY
jgi:type I restriction enzyme R subunit